MNLYLARHGRTNYNDLGLCNADPTVDVHLTALGIEQAKANRSKTLKERAASFTDNLLVMDCEAVLIVTSDWIIRLIVARLNRLTNEQAWALEVSQGHYLKLEV